jgi:hypothetical protein
VKYKLSILILILPVLTARAQERNMQVWNINSIEVKINEKISVGFTEKVNFFPSTGILGQKSGDIFLKRRFSDWFEIGMSGRLGWSKQADGWLHEKRSILFSKFMTGWGQLDLDFVNRLEYRMYRNLNDYFRYKQMVLLEIPPLYKSTWFKVYIAEESFFRFDEKQFHLLRFHSGTKIRCSSNFELKFYYVLEKSKNPIYWATSDILGLNLNVDF